MWRNKNDKKERPSIYIKSIDFKDGTKLDLNPNSIVIFTGANNCGKSQILRDIEALIHDSNSETIVVNKLNVEFKGDLDQSFFKGKINIDEKGYYYIENYSLLYNQLKENWDSKNLYYLYRMFVSRLDTEERLISSKTKQLYGQNRYEKINALNKLYNSNELEDKISSLFYEGFNQELIVNRRYGIHVALHVGERPKWEGERDGESMYYRTVNSLPLLDSQGDGMRSFASIILDAFTSDFPITLIDEPEAFLHPPQARIIGKMFGGQEINNRQLFISTHSAEVINGLLDANNSDTNVIRINRNNCVNNIFCLDNQEIQELWRNPILRYSNIFDGLFHKKVVVCESDYDCLFYKAILDSILENTHISTLDIMFTHCGGKARMKDVVSALRALNVPVIAIPDFDIIDNKRQLSQLCKSFGIKIEEMETELNKIYDCINSNNGELRRLIKNNGYSVLKGESYSAYLEIEKIFYKKGLFIVPVGELESFDKSNEKNKKDWVYSILERGNLNEDNKLNRAREFIQKIIDF